MFKIALFAMKYFIAIIYVWLHAVIVTILGVYLCNAPFQARVRWRDMSKSFIQLGGYHLGFLTKSKMKQIN
jgi:hypothetical protein